MSMTTGNHLHQTFKCTNPHNGYWNAYGQLLTESEVLILDLVKMECWIDGSSAIPEMGCPNFKRSATVNSEVE